MARRYDAGGSGADVDARCDCVTEPSFIALEGEPAISWARCVVGRQRPPLTAIRIVTLAGLNPEQGAMIAKLFLAMIAHSEGADVADPPALRPALEAARAVLDDPRARGSCPAPVRRGPSRLVGRCT